MRSKQEMLELIVTTAERDERIRAVLMNGSRTNPHAPPDIFQDFDIVYVVTDVASFTQDHRWIQRFGEMLIMQLPEEMHDPPPRQDGSFAYLMQFTDGNRIDLGLFSIAKLPELEPDSLSLVLLDKDGLIPQLAPPSERDNLPRPPTSKEFADCCNEFWWVCLYVAKGLWREELVYAKYLMDRVVREQLMKMLTWYVGVQTQFLRNPGKFGKYLKQYLESELWELLQHTYADASAEKNWDALTTMGALFRRTAMAVAAPCGFAYPQGEDEKVTAHLQHVRGLPKTATELY